MKNKIKLKNWEKTLAIIGLIMIILIGIVSFMIGFNFLIINNQMALCFSIFLGVGLSLFLIGIEKKIFGWTRKK
jgi:hypothetical protein